jgi:hypothetical protein
MLSVKSAMMRFEDRYQKLPEGSITLRIEKSEYADSEILVDVDLKNYPLRDYRNIWSDMQNTTKSSSNRGSFCCVGGNARTSNSFSQQKTYALYS